MTYKAKGLLNTKEHLLKVMSFLNEHVGNGECKSSICEYLFHHGENSNQV